MALRHKVRLPPDMIDRCNDHAKVIVDAYAVGLNRRSLSVASRGAEGNIALQAQAKMAEVAFCLWADLDPFQALRWSELTDSGFDVVVKSLRFDVKHTPHGAYLLWPANKAHFFDEAPIDAFVLVKGVAPEFEISRWIPKVEFAAKHQVAEPGHSRFDPGTLYVHESDMRPMWDSPYHCICGRIGFDGFCLRHSHLKAA